MRIGRAAAIILCIVFIALCFANPAAFVSAGTEGLNLLYRAVLPVLFPFFFISGFIINMSPNGSRHGVLSAVLLSLFSGYPNGARLVGALHARGEIDETRARNLCIYTSTPSPIFAAVSVGTVMLGSTLLGILIFAAAVIGAALNGLLWCLPFNFLSTERKLPKKGLGVAFPQTPKRFSAAATTRLAEISVLGEDERKRFEVSATTPCSLPAAGGVLCVSCRTSIQGDSRVSGTEGEQKGSPRVLDTSPQNTPTGPAVINLPAPPPLLKVFNQSLSGAVTAIFNVCGVILIFYIAVSVLNAPPLLSGIIEMTAGANAVSAGGLPTELSAMLICFVVSFGGLSVAMQSFIFMREYNMPPLNYFAFKFTHAVLSTAVLSGILLLL